MRTIIMMVAMLFATVCSADARKVISISLIKIMKERPKCEWSLKAGYMMNSLSGYSDMEVDDLSPGFTSGFDLSLGFLRPFKVKGNAYWGFQLGIGTRGGAASSGDRSYINSERDWNNNGNWRNYRYVYTWNTNKMTLYVPHVGPLIGYSFKLGDKNKLNLHLAVEYSYLLDKEYEIVASGPVYDVETNEQTGSFTSWTDIDFSGSCIEPEIGVDYYFNKWFVSAAYRHGVFLDDCWQSKNIFIGLGYQF